MRGFRRFVEGGGGEVRARDDDYNHRNLYRRIHCSAKKKKSKMVYSELDLQLLNVHTS